MAHTLLDIQLYDFIFRTTSDGIIVADAGLVVRQMNPAAAGLLSVVYEEIIGRNVTAAFQSHPALINLFTRHGEQTLDVRLPRRRLAMGVGTTLENSERLVMLSDVTEKRELDNRRDSLMKTMTHDLRNPISAIIGYADLVTKFGDLNAQQMKFMGRLQQTTTKLYDVISPLVDLAWIEAGMPLEHRPIQLRDIINKAINRLTSLALEHKIVIAVSVQNPMPKVMGDPARLEQVVYSLLHNAIIYSHPEQTVVIHGWGDTHEVYCSVADRGIGIADEELELIFDRMYRSTDEYVRSIPGAGLGLTAARTIITRHGGDLWASSNLGQGSTFTFVLPTLEL